MCENLFELNLKLDKMSVEVTDKINESFVLTFSQNINNPIASSRLCVYQKLKENIYKLRE